jgi:ubiquinone/menaquinone biosynthesis C-methylase UbiE
MLERARQNVRQFKLDERIRIDKANARAMSYLSASFSAVMSNSIIHHIPEPRDAFSEIVRVAAPGASIFVRDLMRPADLAALNNLVAAYAGDANAHQQKMFGDSLHAALALDEVQTLVAAHGFDSATVRQTSDRHWTWSASKR